MPFQTCELHSQWHIIQHDYLTGQPDADSRIHPSFLYTCQGQHTTVRD